MRIAIRVRWQFDYGDGDMALTDYAKRSKPVPEDRMPRDLDDHAGGLPSVKSFEQLEEATRAIVRAHVVPRDFKQEIANFMTACTYGEFCAMVDDMLAIEGAPTTSKHEMRDWLHRWAEKAR